MMDVHSVKRRIEEFDQRHGSDFVCVGKGAVGGYLLYHNGAIRDRDPYGILKEPPDDLYERAKLVAQFWTIRRDLARDEFQQYKHELETLARATLGQSVPGPVPDQEEARKKLTRLKAKVGRAQRRLDKAMAEVEANKPSHLVEREAQNQRHRQAAQELLSTVEAIEI